MDWRRRLRDQSVEARQQRTLNSTHLATDHFMPHARVHRVPRRAPDVAGALAAVVGTGEIFVSGGAEHQGPDGGGPCALVVRRGTENELLILPYI